jgi:hypothetical protein
MAAFVRSLWRAATQEENMTQLNLSGRQSNHAQQKPAAEPEDESIKNQTVGALGALAMFAAVIVIGSCSRSSKPVAVQQPIQPTAPVSAPAVTAPAPVLAPVAKAKAKKRRAATLSYINPAYGLSFNFPRSYQLKAGKEVQVASATSEPLQMNFVHPGGVTLAALEMPGNSYPGTDFKSASVNVSVNPGMTSEACAQFAFPEPSTTTDTPSPVKIEAVKIGAIEFQEVENSATMRPGDAKYYHVFSNGACYEFALAIGTDRDRNVEEITPVDREQVFGKLERILATVKFQPAVTPETQAPVPAVAAAAPADSSNAPTHAREEGATPPNF